MSKTNKPTVLVRLDADLITKMENECSFPGHCKSRGSQIELILIDHMVRIEKAKNEREATREG